MNAEEKIYSLMVQAEDIQAHAQKLQNGAEKTFEALPLAVEQAGKKIRSTGLLGALFVLAVAVVVSAIAVAGVWWGTSSLRSEAADLKAAIRAEQATLAELQGKTWGLELVDYGKEGRGIILPKGVKVDRTGAVQDGRIGIVIKP